MPGLRDSIRARAFSLIDRAPGKVGDLARKANEALGRPLADEAELEDRRAFASRGGATVTTASKPVPSGEPVVATAPVIVYHMDKTRRDAVNSTDSLVW